ncbi:transposase [Streptomyces flaveolus]|uniref:transposase n=1 Tax=Streptomyces flaveolus TaxID=67297 RepID=UPI003700D198
MGRTGDVDIDADSGQRVDVLPDRKAATVTAWLREHPGVRVVCRDGSGGFAQATTDADPTIVQAGDRRHLWHGLAETALEETGAHASCRSTFGPPLREGKRAATTRERWQQAHDLLDQGVGLLACARRLGVCRNTVKRYARHSELRGELRDADHWAHQALPPPTTPSTSPPPRPGPPAVCRTGPGRQKGPVPRIGGRDLMERRAGLAPAFPRRKRGVLP